MRGARKLIGAMSDKYLVCGVTTLDFLRKLLSPLQAIFGRLDCKTFYAFLFVDMDCVVGEVVVC